MLGRPYYLRRALPARHPAAAAASLPSRGSRVDRRAARCSVFPCPSALSASHAKCVNRPCRPGRAAPSFPPPCPNATRAVSCQASAKGADIFSRKPYRIAGFSVSDEGFVCILSPLGSSLVVADAIPEEGDKLALLVPITEAAGDDQVATSPEALTLLQLAESIDMGICLPYDAVQELVGGEGYDPREDYIEGLSVEAGTVVARGAAEEGGFCAAMVVAGGEYEATDPFQALGLIMRYKAALFVAEGAAESGGEPMGGLRKRLPLLVTMEELQQQEERLTDNISTAFKVLGQEIGSQSELERLRRQLEEREKGKGV